MSDLLFDAHLALRAPSRGGRRRAIADGYRGSVFWGDVDAGGAPRTNDVILRLAEPLEPGAEGAVTMVPFVAENWTEKARGDRFSLLEGARAVGAGRITTAHPDGDGGTAARREMATQFERRLRDLVATGFGLEKRADVGADFRIALQDADGVRRMLVGDFKPEPTISAIEQLAAYVDASGAAAGLLVGDHDLPVALHERLAELPLLTYVTLSELERPEQWSFLAGAAAATLELAA